MSERKKGIVWAETEVLYLAATTAFYLFSPLKESVFRLAYTANDNFAIYCH